MKNILLLTDFSDLSGYAKDLADKVASSLGATLHVVKIVDTPSSVTVSPEGDLLDGMGNDLSGLIAEKEASDQKMKTWVANLKANYKETVAYGSILYRVKEYSKSNDIDLIIMGTNEVSGLQEVISGSLTQQIILNNPIPVLSLKCDRGNIDFSDFLITGDYEQKNEMNFDTIKALQKVFNSKIHMLCVNTKQKFKTTSQALKCMKNFAEINGLENVEYHVHGDKTVEEGIVNFANNYDANHDLDIDIIAVEKKNKSTLNYWFTGCEAIEFVNHIYRPMITYLSK